MILIDMMDGGLLVDGWEAAEVGEESPVRRYFQLTDAGRTALGSFLRQNGAGRLRGAALRGPVFTGLPLVVLFVVLLIVVAVLMALLVVVVDARVVGGPGPCVDCSPWNLICRAGEWIDRCP